MFTKYYDDSMKIPDFREGGHNVPPLGPQACSKTQDQIGLKQSKCVEIALFIKVHICVHDFLFIY